jgi:NAD(P)-dependent dehydrogenase (short-subunit alcohol dehydrogenase family)
MSQRKGPALNFPLFTEKWWHEPYPFISPTRPELSAAGKNVVVTGGGTGIGKAIAAAFVQAGAASVSILGRREAVLASAVQQLRTGGSTRLLTAAVNLTDLTATTRALQELTAQTGPVDVLVSNAGTCPAPKPLAEHSAEELLKTFESNCVATFHALRAFSGVAAEGAVVVHVSSVAAHMAPFNPGGEMLSYCVAKAASLRIVGQFAVENPGVHVVSIHPGFIWSEMTESIFTREACPDGSKPVPPFGSAERLR